MFADLDHPGAWKCVKLCCLNLDVLYAGSIQLISDSPKEADDTQ